MLEISLRIPDDLERELLDATNEPEKFILEALRQRFEQLESERQYAHECRSSCFASTDHLSPDEEETWETI